MMCNAITLHVGNAEYVFSCFNYKMHQTDSHTLENSGSIELKNTQYTSFGR